MDYYRNPDFPNSFNEPFIKTSLATEKYNCIAHAVFNDSEWYEPAKPEYLTFWPNDVPREYTIDAYFQLFESYGYSKCKNGDIEEGFIKIAFFYSTNKYNNPDSFHAARQLSDGQWTSKLGESIDVSHTLNAMSNSNYGEVIQFFKKKQD